MKFFKQKRILAFLMAAVMAVMTLTSVHADYYYDGYESESGSNAVFGATLRIWIEGDTLYFESGAGEGDPSRIAIFSNGNRFHTLDPGTTSINIRSLLDSGRHSVQARLEGAGGAMHGPLSNSVSWDPAGAAGDGTLQRPGNLRVDESNVLRWDRVPGATWYRIYLGEQVVDTTGNTYSTNWTVTLGSTVTFRVIAGNTAAESAVATVTWTMRSQPLPTPTGLSLSGTTLSWNQVANAANFSIYADGTRIQNNVGRTYFNLAGANIATGNRSIQVRANAATGRDATGQESAWSNSALSTAVTFAAGIRILDAPGNVNISGFDVSWGGVAGSRGFRVYIDGTARSGNITNRNFDLEGLNLAPGTHSVQIRALGNGTTILDSELSPGVNFIIATEAAAPTPTPTPTPTPQPTPIPTQEQPVEQPSGWAAESVSAAIYHGLVPLNLQMHFTETTTRAEFAALAVALHEVITGVEIEERMTFNDTDDVNVQKMGALGVVLGTGYGDFLPYDTLTREQAAVMLTRLADVLERPLPWIEAEFIDNDMISSWAIEAVGRVQATGIMEGVGGGMFSPWGPYTREQSIVTILRMFDVVR